MDDKNDKADENHAGVGGDKTVKQCCKENKESENNISDKVLDGKS